MLSFSASTDCATTPNREIGKYQPAICPVDLPAGSDLSEKLDFGYVSVPEEHAKPDGPVIQVAVARCKSTGDQPASDPIVLINGGPGDSNLDLFIRLMVGPIGKAFLAQRDVVIIELRGLRYSKPNLVCEEVFEAQLGMVDKDLKGDEVNQVLLRAMRASHDRFVKEGINLSAYNNVESAADIALVMTTLKYDQFNMLAASAGTIVAQHVMRANPARVRSVILNAAVPIGLPFFRDMILNGAESLQRVFKLCEADSACHLVYPNLEDRFFAHIDKLNKEPVTIPVKNPTTGEEVNFVLNGDRLSTWLFVSM
jgi:pimeloyl-ACP methyl ester carboxylesterase